MTGWQRFWRVSTFIAACCFAFNIGWQAAYMWQNSPGMRATFMPVLITAAVLATADLISNMKFFRRYRLHHRELVAFVESLPRVQADLEARRARAAGCNCPFYGFSSPLGTSVMIPTRGNQCSLVQNAYAPCYLEINGKAVEWHTCDRVRELHGEEHLQWKKPL